MLEEAWPEPCLTPWPLTSKPSVIILMPGPCGSHLQYFCFSTWSTGLPTDTSTSSSLTTPSTPHHAGLMGAPRSSRLACFQAKLCINLGKNAKNKKWSPRCRTGWSGFWGEKKNSSMNWEKIDRLYFYAKSEIKRTKYHNFKFYTPLKHYKVLD